jgi:hypothetical protein
MNAFRVSESAVSRAGWSGIYFGELQRSIFARQFP